MGEDVEKMFVARERVKGPPLIRGGKKACPSTKVDKRQAAGGSWGKSR